MNTIAGDESESLSDIDDDEMKGYFHDNEEKSYKKIIWEEMNRVYIEEQAAKKAAAAAAKEARMANLQHCPAAVAAKSKKERQQKRAAKREQAPSEAPRQVLTKKRASSKINYDVLDKLFDDSTVTEAVKKQRTDGIPASMEVRGEEEEAPESVLVDDEDYEEDGNGGVYEYDCYGDGSSYYGYEENGYGNDEDYNFDC